eukprot:gene321-717_t
MPEMKKGKDSKFFGTTKRGEIHELKEELHSLEKSKQKDAVKKVIAAMTVGKDVSVLFPDMVNLMQTTNMEVKKMVYLYCINYAKAQPELAVLAINTFRKDASDPNPMVRALAVRTMGCIRLDNVTEYLLEPLKNCCTDSDSYVRKTAAICIAKVYQINPSVVEDQGLLEQLDVMVNDANATVVANAVVALAERSQASGRDLVIVGEKLPAMLAALNEASEWGQVFILDAIAGYTPANRDEAQHTVERVSARLAHSNPAVVLSAVKVILNNLPACEQDVQTTSLKKLEPALVSLLSSKPEMQYVALKCMNLVVQRVKGVLGKEIRAFFCKYNDPTYIKLEKLEMLIKLVNERNCSQVLDELKEYAREVDIDFSRKAIKAMGRIAVKVESCREQATNEL